MKSRTMLTIATTMRVFATCSRGGFRAGQVRLESARRARVRRIQGIRGLGGDPITHRRVDEADSRQSGGDRRLSGRHSRQRQTLPRWRQDGESRVATEKSPDAPYDIDVPGPIYDLDFMVKDAKRVRGQRRMGLRVFEHDAGPAPTSPPPAHKPPQGNDAKCGSACHTIVKGKDYVFTEYAKR